MGNTLLFIGFSPGNNSTSAFYIGDYSSVYFQVSKMLTFYLFFSHLPFLFFLQNIYLFISALGLRCCTWAFSSCSEWGATF